MRYPLSPFIFSATAMILFCVRGTVSFAVTDDAIEQYVQEVKKEKEASEQDVISEEVKQRIIDGAIQILELAENYTPENYAQRYDQMSETAAPSTQRTYKEFRQRHMDENIIPGVHVTFVPDRASARIEIKKKYGTEFDYAEVFVQGQRSVWTSAEPAKRTGRYQYRVWMNYDPTQPREKQITHGSWTLEEAK